MVWTIFGIYKTTEVYACFSCVLNCIGMLLFVTKLWYSDTVLYTISCTHTHAHTHAHTHTCTHTCTCTRYLLFLTIALSSELQPMGMDSFIATTIIAITILIKA